MASRTLLRGISRKFLFWFLLVAVVPLVFLTLVVTFQMEDSAREEASQHLVAIRDMKVSHFRLWLQEKQVDVRVLAEDSVLKELVEALDRANYTERGLIEEARGVLRKQLSLKRDFIGFFLVDRSTGVILLSTDPELEGQNRSGDPYLTGPLDKNGTYVKDIYRSELLGGSPSMTISTPVYCSSHGGEHITAVIVGRVDLENSLFALLKDRAGLGTTGEMVLVNRESVALNSLINDPDAPLKLKITAEPASLAAEGGTGIVDARDYAGKKVLSAYTHFPELGWGFVVKMDHSEVYEPIFALARRVTITGLAFLFLASVLAIVVSKGLARPLESIAEVSEKIAGGDLEIRSPFEDRFDEIGDLAGSINTMAEKLKARFGLLEGISGINEAAVGSRDREGFARAIFSVIINRMNAQMGVFYALSSDGKTLTPSFSMGMEPEAREPMDRSSLEGLLGLSSIAGEVTVIRQVKDSPPFVFRGPGGVVEAREIMTIPLSVSGELEGLACLGSITSFSEEDEELARGVRHVLSTGLDRILASERMQEITLQLQDKNRELHSQAEELIRQSEEMRGQNLELEHQRRMLEEADRLKSEFLSNMSHELRTPLNSILALSRILMRRGKGQKDEEGARYIEVIERNGRQLLELINDILDLSKIESGRVDIRPSFFQLRETVESLVETLAPVAAEKGISLEIDIPDDLPPMRTDESMLRQILRNLIGNAVKFTSEGGVSITASTGGDEVLVRVRDTGIGIPEDELPFIFDEFRQVDGSAARRFEGTGLGLAIASKTAMLLGGSIEVESQVGSGSVFSLLLPARWSGSLAQELESMSLQGLSRGPLLVVDDDHSVAESVSTILKKDGFEAVIAGNGPEALRMARTLHPVAITLDIIMPDMDGWEVLQHLKKDPETRDIPVIILSMTREEYTASALGADGYLTKPLDRSALMEEIRRVCGREDGKVVVAGDAFVNDGPTERTVLMVEDNDIAAAQVKGLLEDEKIARVDVVQGGQQALDYVKERVPDAIILDLMMPGMDGFEVLDQLRGTEKTSRIPVLILTAKDLTREELSTLRNNHVQQLVQKGDIDRDGLLRKVRLLFHESGAGPGDLRPDVLYIEDDPDNMTTMRAVLGERFRMAGASSGEEGLLKAVTMRPGIILLDLALPDLDGFGVLSRLRSNPATAGIPVAAVTARAMKGDREKALRAGFSAYLAKPLIPDEIHSVLSELLGQASV